MSLHIRKSHPSGKSPIWNHLRPTNSASVGRLHGKRVGQTSPVYLTATAGALGTSLSRSLGMHLELQKESCRLRLRCCCCRRSLSGLTPCAASWFSWPRPGTLRRQLPWQDTNTAVSVRAARQSGVQRHGEAVCERHGEGERQLIAHVGLRLLGLVLTHPPGFWWRAAPSCATFPVFSVFGQFGSPKMVSYLVHPKWSMRLTHNYMLSMFLYEAYCRHAHCTHVSSVSDISQAQTKVPPNIV